MMDKYELMKRLKTFAQNCVKLASSLPNNIPGNHTKNQTFRRRTSGAVNFGAVILAQSNAACATKLSVAIEEVDECNFWI